MPFEHLTFTRTWELSAETTYQLGQCRALLDSVSAVPISPEVQRELKQVSLIKGAQATVAIEGNTLSEDDIRKVSEGKTLSPSKYYQGREVENILHAMAEVVRSNSVIITPELLKHYHHLIGNGLPEPFNATPGEFAQSQRTVGNYRCPPPGRGKNEVEGLIMRLCDWLQNEFGFTSGKQTFRDALIQAIVTHVYIEWIHPFDDGNGRTGRLVEFYLLLRAGVPDICAHILSNHYNNTRPEYYAHLSQCQKSGTLTPFIAYALTGFLDGLREVWGIISDELLKRAWRGYVYDKFAEIKWKRPTFKRRRQLLLDMEIDMGYEIDTIEIISPRVAQEYSKLGSTAIKRDVKSLMAEELLVESKFESGVVMANVAVIKAQYPKHLQP